MLTIILAIVLFVLLIFPHELGHFVAAKAVGVRVNEFAFGMGPALYKKQGRETLYSIRAFPVGGYCAMEGENEELVLHDVSFSIDPDETVVLVGHTGAGKSTCANLLLRYWDPGEGQITVGGRDLRDYRISAVRKMISAVQQETYLFHTSVRDNIRIGCLDATDEEIVSASVKANAEEFIDALPEGYDTVTGERGFRLSGGQRQRIAIARALLRDAPIVIFDEAVSSLDTENEKYLQETLRTQLEGKTVLMIAHRLSTIVAADKIVMLEHGRVVATGSHEELLATSGPYRNLIGKQLENVAPV